MRERRPVTRLPYLAQAEKSVWRMAENAEELEIFFMSAWLRFTAQDASRFTKYER